MLVSAWLLAAAAMRFHTCCIAIDAHVLSAFVSTERRCRLPHQQYVAYCIKLLPWVFVVILLLLLTSRICFYSQQKKKVQAASTSKKREKMTRDEMESELFNLFAQQQHWHFTQLQVRLQQAGPDSAAVVA